MIRIQATGQNFQNQLVFQLDDNNQARAEADLQLMDQQPINNIEAFFMYVQSMLPPESSTYEHWPALVTDIRMRIEDREETFFDIVDYTIIDSH